MGRRPKQEVGQKVPVKTGKDCRSLGRSPAPPHPLRGYPISTSVGWKRRHGCISGGNWWPWSALALSRPRSPLASSCAAHNRPLLLGHMTQCALWPVQSRLYPTCLFHSILIFHIDRLVIISFVTSAGRFPLSTVYLHHIPLTALLLLHSITYTYTIENSQYMWLSALYKLYVVSATYSLHHCVLAAGQGFPIGSSAKINAAEPYTASLVFLFLFNTQQ